MKYKQIILNRDHKGVLYFSEHNLPYDREDEGERIIRKIRTSPAERWGFSFICKKVK